MYEYGPLTAQYCTCTQLYSLVIREFYYIEPFHFHQILVVAYLFIICILAHLHCFPFFSLLSFFILSFFHSFLYQTAGTLYFFPLPFFFFFEFC